MVGTSGKTADRYSLLTFIEFFSLRLFVTLYFIQVDNNGAGSFSFSKKELVGLYGLSSGDPSKDYEDYLYRYGYSMVVNATFTEELTDKKGDGQAVLRFYKTGVKLNFPDYNPSSFKPGLEYIALVGGGTFTSGYSPKEKRVPRIAFWRQNPFFTNRE